MEKAKENNQPVVCGYCGKQIVSESKVLTITDAEDKIIEKVNICNVCLKKIQFKIKLSKMPKEDVKSLDDFLRRNKK